MNDLQKMDDVFSETRKREEIPIEEAFALIGASVRKTAAEANLTDRGVVPPMQRAYLVAQAVEGALEGEGETVSVPAGLLSAVRADAEGGGDDPLPISEAMAVIKSALPAPEGEGGKPVAKSDEPVVWGADLADGAQDEAVNWGDDPQWADAG